MFILNEGLSSTDSAGNILTREQLNFFKDSEMVDSTGKLQQFYHGTNSQFTVFKTDVFPCFFTASKGYALDITVDEDDAGNKLNKYLKTVYLNIKHCFDLQSLENRQILKSIADKEDYTIIDSNNLMTPYLMDKYYLDLRDLCITLHRDFDGLKVIEHASTSYFNKYGKNSGYSIVPFYSNQIKSITNLSPTNSNDINK